VEVRDALNTIWRAPVSNTALGFSGVLFIVRERLYALLIVLGGGLFLLVSILLNATLTAMGTYLQFPLPAPGALLHGIDFLVSFLATSGLFAAIYKFLPEVRLCWSDVAVGACATALFFTMGKQILALYIGRASIGSAYGAAASLAVLLIWVYYSAQLFFLGAEFTKIYTKTFGSHVKLAVRSNEAGSGPT
jgi:membrane protein